MEPQEELIMERARPSAVDAQITEAYELYQRQGSLGFLISRCFSLFTMATILVAILFLTNFIQWSILGTLSTDTTLPFSSLFRWHLSGFSVFFMIICCVGLTLRVLYSLAMYMQLKETESMYSQCQDWELLEQELVKKLGLTGSVELRQRLMRKEHYIQALFQEGPLKRVKKYSSQALDWCLHYTLWGHIFEPGTGLLKMGVCNGQVDTDGFAKQIKTQALFCLIFSPVMIIYYLIYGLFGYAEQIRRSPSLITGRVWTQEARRTYVRYNELPHQSTQRLQKAALAAEKYLQSDAGGLFSPFIRWALFVIGTFGLMLVLIGTVNANAWTNVLIGQSNLLYFTGLVGVLISFGQGLLPDDHVKCMRKDYEVDLQTNYPEIAIKELSKDYVPRWQYFLIEAKAMVCVPWIVFKELPALIPDILSFLSRNTRESTLQDGSFYVGADYQPI